jgi:ATP-dependent RNA helicase DDX3X
MPREVGRLITDEEVQAAFDRNPENEEMAVYEGVEVSVHSKNEIPPIHEFPGCGVSNSILLNVAEAGYKSPTNVQKYSIPYILNGEDLIVTSQTGSGKTAAFMLPVITNLTRQGRDPNGNPSIVILVPVREIGYQIIEETLRFCGRGPLKTVGIFGGAPMGPQVNELRYGCDIIIATPGRLIDVMNRRCLTLSCIRALILDEADRMLDMGFEPQISAVINDFDMPVAEHRQTLLFSATFPREVQNLARQFMRSGVTRIEIGLQDAPTLIEQRFIYVPEASKFSMLLDIIHEIDGQTLVFAERKVSVDRIEEYLYDEDCAVVAIHGDREMPERRSALRGFTNGKAKIMVATDVAARGLDIPNVAHVINMDLPNDTDTYTHRIGRTGRAGKHGLATSFWNGNNAQFLVAFIQHLRESRLPIPTGLENFQSGRRGGGGGGGGRDRGGFRRGYSMYG